MVIVRAMFLVLLMAPAWAQLSWGDAEPHTVTVGINNAPPYRLIQGDQAEGLDVEVFKAISAQLGWSVRYWETPIRRGLMLAEEGKVDVLLGPERTAGREQYLDFVIPAFPAERLLFFYQTGTQRIENYEDLYGRIIGVREGASYFPRFDADEGIMKESATKYTNLMRMLELGRVDVVVAPEVVGRYAAQRLGMEVSVSPFSVAGERRYIAVSKNSPLHDHTDDLRNALSQDELDIIYRERVANYLDKSN